jgi:hypothetical protein
VSGNKTRSFGAPFGTNVIMTCRPEDIFGSVEVNSKGEITGNFQPSGTYRIVTNEGM